MFIAKSNCASLSFSLSLCSLYSSSEIETLVLFSSSDSLMLPTIFSIEDYLTTTISASCFSSSDWIATTVNPKLRFFCYYLSISLPRIKHALYFILFYVHFLFDFCFQIWVFCSLNMFLDIYGFFIWVFDRFEFFILYLYLRFSRKW